MTSGQKIKKMYTGTKTTGPNPPIAAVRCLYQSVSGGYESIKADNTQFLCAMG